jgi:hypothetical protein
MFVYASEEDREHTPNMLALSGSKTLANTAGKHL